ncbi:hypothetical protein FQR65_LT18335 [Abscondita terminalis]|nr:hypothetical protein FQR65_LT18335 [Abscondita terminalis]
MEALLTEISYVLVEFLYQGVTFVSAAPKKWINDETVPYFCSWPKKNNERKAIKDALDPGSDWSLFCDVKILGEYTTYKEALFNEKKLSKTDNEDTDVEEQIRDTKSKRKIKPNPKYRNTITPPPSIVEFSDIDDNVLSSVSSHSSESKSNSSENSSVNKLIIDNIHNAEIIFEEETIPTAVNHKTCDLDMKTVLEAIINVAEILKTVEVRLTSIEQKLNIPLQIEDFLNFTLPIPCKNLLDLQKLEEEMRSKEDFNNKLVLRLTGGSNEKNCITKCLENILTNYCAMFCSWTGKKGNFKVKDLKTMETLKSAVRVNFPHSLDDTFEKYVMQWLQFAKVRHDRGRE